MFASDVFNELLVVFAFSESEVSRDVRYAECDVPVVLVQHAPRRVLHDHDARHRMHRVARDEADVKTLDDEMIMT